VDQSLVRWVEHDGVGRAARNGLNFTERGFGVRAALGSYDRGHTAVSQLKPGDIDWDQVFGKPARAGFIPAASSAPFHRRPRKLPWKLCRQRGGTARSFPTT